VGLGGTSSAASLHQKTRSAPNWGPAAQARKIMNLANSKKPAFGTQKYQPKRSEKWRNMDIEIANESLLKKMVQIVNRPNQYLYSAKEGASTEENTDLENIEALGIQG
jgi:hypothetical protein